MTDRDPDVMIEEWLRWWRDEPERLTYIKEDSRLFTIAFRTQLQCEIYANVRNTILSLAEVIDDYEGLWQIAHTMPAPIAKYGDTSWCAVCAGPISYDRNDPVLHRGDCAWVALRKRLRDILLRVDALMAPGTPTHD